MAVRFPLHICLVTQQLGKVTSGPGIYSRNVLQQLIQDGNRVTVVSLSHQAHDDLAGYQFIGVENRIFRNNQARWIGNSLSFRQALRKLELDSQVDLVHFTDARESFFCNTKVARIGNINDTYSADIQPISYYYRNYSDWPTRWGYYQFVHLFERIHLAKLDAIISNSIYTTQTIQKFYSNTLGKLHTVYKSVNPAQFEPVLQMRQSRTDFNNPSILMVGTNLQRKGIRTLIRAAPQIRQSIPDVVFKIAGGDPVVPRLKRFCVQQGVADFFSFLGHQTRDQLYRLYAECDVLVHPALTEALGVVLLEAMASGLPVIGTNVGGIPEIIEDGLNGLLIPPSNSSALAEAVVHLVQSRKLQERFSLSGLETVKKFNVSNMMKDTYEVYSQVLARV